MKSFSLEKSCQKTESLYNPPAMDPGTLAQLVAQIGLPSALVAFFVWRGDKREAEMSRRLEQLEQSQSITLKTVVMENTKAFLTQTIQFKRLSQKVEDCPRRGEIAS